MEVLRLRCLTVLLVALAWTVRASTRPERNPSKELKECFGPESDRDRQTSPYFERCGLPEKRWLVITERRSGSRWLVNTMAERTGEVVPYTSEIGNCHGCYCGLVGAKPGGPEDRECTCRLAGYYSKFADQLTESTGDGACDNYHHYGFKWMHAPQYTEEGSFDVLARSLCDLDIPVAFMWRRNVLRRIISELSNHEQSHSGLNLAHPTTNKEVQALLEYKPRMKADRIVDKIKMEIASQKALEQSFQRLTKDCAARNPIVFYYEDLKDGAMHAESRWGELFASLKIWSPSELAIIHGDKPVMDTIANPRDVYEALEGTKYEWMVRE